MLPREKLQKFGASALKDYELISIILNTGSKNLNVFKLAQKIAPIVLNPNQENIARLQNIPGIGEAKMSQIYALLELGRRLRRVKGKQTIALRTPAAVVEFFSNLRNLETEVLVGVLLSSDMLYHSHLTISRGDTSSVTIDLKPLLESCFKHQISKVILIHNHPSGSTTPSNADIRTTALIHKLLQLVNIALIDHIIISSKDFFSFKLNKIL